MSTDFSYSKMLIDVTMIYSLFWIYSMNANFYENGYWIDNHSITNMYDGGRVEYVLLILFCFYNIYLWYCIKKLQKPYPVEKLFIEKKLSEREKKLQNCKLLYRKVKF